MMFKRRLDNFMSDQTRTRFRDILFTQINIVCCLGIIEHFEIEKEIDKMIDKTKTIVLIV